MREWSDNDDETEEGLSDLSARELKDALRMRGLLVSGRKEALTSHLILLLE